MNSAVPFLGLSFVPVAVMSSQVSEHSRSATTLPSAPEEVPVTLISVHYMSASDASCE